MLRDIALQSATKGGPGSGFSDPSCRRGIPGQRGGSVNICKPGGLARAVALGVDVSDVDVALKDIQHDFGGPTKVKELTRIQKVVNERIEEPNRRTLRQAVSQEMKLPVTPHQRDLLLQSWVHGPKTTGMLWSAAADIRGVDLDEWKSRGVIPPSTTGMSREKVQEWAQSLAADNALSQSTWEPQTLHRGLKIRNDRGVDWDGFMDWVKDAPPDMEVFMPNNFLESWSSDEEEARRFATGWRPEGDTRGIVMQRRIEPEDVFISLPALHSSRADTMDEKETIVWNANNYQPILLKDLNVVEDV